MRSILAIAICLIAPLAHAAQKTAIKLDYDAAWTYSLTVTAPSEEEFFTISLLKDNQLSYDYWMDTDQAAEKTVSLTPEQVKTLTAKFADAYTAIAKSSDKKGGVIFALEKIEGQNSTTYKMVGTDASINGLLAAAKSILGNEYPFKVN
ncbi:hypothetical protein [Cerasicoccus arenae]|uniref:Uncharacterized protein n=1 Tax=Cerasicoccus arenae TaxID=424488 RepID=A0A8J3DAP8_9BACT|nr:hypothetical protein [Cerasicoccus arenae]MBK1858857.1 hypothetical protein [Cerasicoccus arenae]GHB96082.1 hypothetical protein GCM10007047_09770 [Cerasicoccus arenae]